MCADAGLVAPETGLDELVQQAIAEVLMVPRETVHPDSALVADLGAESIDFLDLVFRLEDALHVSIPFARWTSFVSEQLAGQDLGRVITPAVFVRFAQREVDQA